jgi:hypothetical protein
MSLGQNLGMGSRNLKFLKVPVTRKLVVEDYIAMKKKSQFGPLI